MRSPQEIEEKLNEGQPPYINALLQKGLEQDLKEMVLLLSEGYEKAFLRALRHQANGKHVEILATLAWLVGCDLDIKYITWFQFGMPRIRALAKELRLPWPAIGDLEDTLTKSRRMSNGLPCEPKCLRCFQWG